MRIRQIILIAALMVFYGVSAGVKNVPAKSQSKKAVISETENPTGWIIRTKSSVYQIAVADDGIVIPVYYGPAGYYSELNNIRTQVNPKVGSSIREVPFRGGYNNQTPAVEAVFPDGVRDANLVYDNHSEYSPIAGEHTLRIDLKDSYYDLRISLNFKVYPERDIIEKWLTLENTGTKPILLENVQSASIWLQGDEYDLYHLSGKWGHECLLQRTRLTQGVKTLQTRAMRSHLNPPWFAVAPSSGVTETEGQIWFGGLQWSGNWRLDFEKMHSGHVQIVGGINFWDSSWTLDPGETFTTPKAIFGFSPDGMGGASRRMHEHVRKTILRPAYRDKLRPVLYNSWYATTFHVNEKQQIALAQVAKDIGVELFVIDDGWFKGRKHDRAGLGDWTVDKEKFPNGLQPMIEKITGMGLDFGIWVEPEMVNPDSDLYRAHPDWCFHYPTRTRHEGRNQLILNLARKDVYDYLLDSLSKLLSENNIKFIKWDMNRDLTDPGWPDAEPAVQREVRIRYVHNLYRLMRELEKRFPHVWFECCSGGGGRIDYGALNYMDQFWTSDNTDPADRVLIHSGFLHGFPAKTMVSWITDEDWHKIRPTLKFRFHVSMCGVLGIGNDITKWTKEEREEAAKYIRQYKEVRSLVQEGIVHRLISPFERHRSALEYVNEDGSEAAVFLFNLWETLPGATADSRAYQPVRLRGLVPNATYEISGDFKKTASGETLMNVGLPWVPRGNFSSALITVRKK